MHHCLPTHGFLVPATSGPQDHTGTTPHTRKDRQEEDSPTEDHDEVHDIPAIAEVRALMEDEPQGHNFDTSFKAKDPNEIRFRLLLRDEKHG